MVNYKKIINHDPIVERLTKIKKEYTKIVLICNGNVNSGQSLNVDLTNTIHMLSNSNPNILFLVTQNIQNDNTNIVNTSELTNTTPDLLQISLISTFCDVIVGRASGPYCFTHTKDNLLDSSKTYVSFSFNQNEGIWYKKSKAKQYWDSNLDLNHIFTTINNIINDKL